MLRTAAAFSAVRVSLVFAWLFLLSTGDWGTSTSISVSAMIAVVCL
jgi:uncharacterized membrane protein